MATEYKILRDFTWGDIPLAYGQIVVAEKNGDDMHVSIKHFPDKSVTVTEQAFYNFVQSGFLQQY